MAAGGVRGGQFFFFGFTLFPPIFCTIACSVGKPVLGPHEGNENESVGLQKYRCEGIPSERKKFEKCHVAEVGDCGHWWLFQLCIIHCACTEGT